MPSPATRLKVDTLIVNIGELVTLQGPNSSPRRGADLRELGLIHNGAVALSGDRIVAVGPLGEVRQAIAETPHTQILDACGATVTPGLVDPHTHLVFAGSREAEFVQRLEGRTYSEILASGGGIHSTVASTRQASLETLVANGRKHLKRMQANGTTTLEAKSGYGLELETEIKQLEAIATLNQEGPLEIIPTYLGAHAVPAGADPDAFIDRLIEESLPVLASRKLARYCDVFCENGVFSPAQTERLARAAMQLGFGIRLHADELSDLGGGALAAKLGAASADHLLMIGPESIQALSRSNTIAVMLPGTPFFLGMRERAPARKLVDAGVAIAIGTDFNPGSSFSESMPMMMTLAALDLKLTPAEALVASTINAAHSLGLASRIGSLEPGKQADLVIWDVPNHAHLAYHYGVQLTRHVIKKGHLLV